MDILERPALHSLGLCGNGYVRLEELVDDEAGKCVRSRLKARGRLVQARLAQHGLATYPASRASRLARSLTADQLKDLAAAKGIVVKGKKDAIAAAVADHVDESELERLAPGEFVELVGMPHTKWMTYRRAFIELWAHTMTMSGFKLREIRDASDMRDLIKGYSIIGDDQCLFCRTKNGTRIRLQDAKPEALPPFHPGCRCATAPWGQWE